jgi:hypothetical protein
LLRKQWKNVVPRSDMRADDFFDLLRSVAWALFAKSTEANRFPNSLVKQAIAEANARGDLPGSPAAIRDDLMECGILIDAGENETGNTQLSFLHRTFLEGDGNQGRTLRAAIASLCRAAGWNPEERVPGSNIILDNRRPGGEAARVSEVFQ